MSPTGVWTATSATHRHMITASLNTIAARSLPEFNRLATRSLPEFNMPGPCCCKAGRGHATAPPHAQEERPPTSPLDTHQPPRPAPLPPRLPCSPAPGPSKVSLFPCPRTLQGTPVPLSKDPPRFLCSPAQGPKDPPRTYPRPQVAPPKEPPPARHPSSVRPLPQGTPTLNCLPHLPQSTLRVALSSHSSRSPPL